MVGARRGGGTPAGMRQTDGDGDEDGDGVEARWREVRGMRGGIPMEAGSHACMWGADWLRAGARAEAAARAFGR